MIQGNSQEQYKAMMIIKIWMLASCTQQKMAAQKMVINLIMMAKDKNPLLTGNFPMYGSYKDSLCLVICTKNVVLDLKKCADTNQLA